MTATAPIAHGQSWACSKREERGEEESSSVNWWIHPCKLFRCL